MMTLDLKEIKERANRLYKNLEGLNKFYKFSIEEGESTVGGGSMPIAN